MDKFEKILRDKLQGHEMPYDPAAWARMEAKLGAPANTGAGWKGYFIGGAAATIIGVGAFLLYNNTNPETPNAEKNTVAAVEKSASENANTSDGSTPEVKTEVTKENAVLNNNNHTSILSNKNNSNTNVVVTPENNSPEVKTNVDEKKSNESGIITTHPNVNHKEQPREQAIVILQPEISVRKNTICKGDVLSFEASNYNNTFDLVWDFGDGSYSREAVTRHKFENEGDYVVTLKYYSKRNNALLAKESNTLVKVNAVPEIDFSWELNQQNAIPTYNFINMTENAGDWSWNFGDGKTSTEKQPDHLFNKKGTYQVMLTAKNNDGCTATGKKELEVENDWNLLTPNSFTPNGDGHNDVFISEALKIMDVKFRMTIFDSRGNKIFETSRIDNPWDGRNSVTGGNCPAGAYVWVVQLTNANNLEEVYQGSVTLIK